LNFLANEVNCIFVAKVKNMATLSGQKVKNAFASLLKLTTNTATTSLKNVESGDGVATALQLATGKVGINGTLEFPTAPATGSTEVKALLLNASNQVVERSLNAAAFSGGALTTASLPLAVSGSDVRMANPSAISDIGTPASGDRFLIYDASLTTWKRIDYSSLAALINPNVYQSAPEVVARLEPSINLTTSPVYLDFAAVGATGNDTVLIGDAATVYTLGNVYGGNLTSFRFNEDGVYEITLSANIETTSTNTDVTFFFDVNGTTIGTSQTRFATISDHFLTQATIINGAGGDVVSVRALASAAAADVKEFSVFHIRKL
jgi:hypothetical protein